VMPLPIEKLTMFMHFGFRMVRSQNAATGMHWNIVEKNTIIYQLAMMTLQVCRAMRNGLEIPKYR